MRRKLKHRKIPAAKRKKRMINLYTKGPLYEILSTTKPEYIIGMDEVGWGAIAGPIVVACAVYKPDWSHEKVRDSKKYASDKTREKAFDIVQSTTAYVGYYEISPGAVETFGAGATLQQGFLTLAQRAISHFPNSLIIIDGSSRIKGLEHPQICIPKADDLVPAVSAASVAAKVSRDHTMIKLGESFPEYEWHSNKGYGTPKHLEAMRKNGVCIHHRRNIQTVLDYEEKHGTYGKGKS